MYHQAAKTLFVAENVAIDLRFLPVFQFFDPRRVCQKLAAHGGALDAPGSKLLLHKIRVVQSTHAADGQLRVPPHLIAEFKETSRLAEIRMIRRRNGIFQSRVICQCHMETGHTCLFQQWNEHGKFFFQDTCIAKMRFFLPDSQLVVNGHSRNCRTNGRNSLHRKAGTVLGTAAIFVRALVEDGGAEAAAHPVAMYLNHIEACLLCQHCGLAKACNDLLNLALGHPGDIGCHCIVQLFAQLIQCDLLHQHNTTEIHALAQREKGKKHTTQRRLIPAYISLILISFISVFPLLWMISAATNTSLDVARGKIMFGTYAVQNFKNLIASQNLAGAMGNSFLYAIVQTVISMFVCSLAGFGFELYHDKNKNRLFSVLLLAMMVPQVATMVPLFKMMSKADLLNSVWAFILPSISTPFLIMMFRQNSRNFPNDLMQAARIDGLSETGIFFRMYVPIMKSTYAAAAVITFRPCRHRDD